MGQKRQRARRKTPPEGARPRCRAALVAQLFILAFSSALPACPALAAPPHFFVGLQGWDDPTAKSLARLQRAQVHSYRLTLRWSRVERTRGSYGWRYYDELFARAAQSHVRVLPILFSSPAWVCNPTCADPRPQWPPKTDADHERFYAFAARAADRYGPGGYFWEGTGTARSERPRWFQVWNEPNLPNFWNRAPDAEAYARFLRRTGKAMKAADPEVRVLAGGVPNPTSRSHVIRMKDFIRRMFAVTGVADIVDGAAIHPYSATAQGVVDKVDAARRALVASPGAARKKLFVTEFGWATGGDNPSLSTTPTGQAQRLRFTYQALLRRRDQYRLAAAYWFNHKDRAPGTGEAVWWGLYTGLFDRYGHPKPSWREYTRVTGGLP